MIPPSFLDYIFEQILGMFYLLQYLGDFPLDKKNISTNLQAHQFFRNLLYALSQVISAFGLMRLSSSDAGSSFGS